MQPYFNDDYTTVYMGDSRNVLSGLSENSVDMIMTSPPY